VATPARSRRDRWAAWSRRPPQVGLIGLAFTICGAWMFFAPFESERHSPFVTPGVGLVSVVFFGGGTAIAFVRWARQRRHRVAVRDRGEG
jgi:hypothetical protein